MLFTSTAAALIATSLLPGTLATTYTLVDNYVGTSFLSNFDHQAISDPTDGTVNYVDQATAVAQNLTYASGNTLILRADSKTVITNGGGRNSVRIRSKKTYTTHVAVFDVRHMPTGCATWPAAWEVREDGWPNYGEVDIVEGVNGVRPNQMTLHTGPNCVMPDNRAQVGTVITEDCDSSGTSNSGCGVAASNPKSFGPSFNTAGGGYFVLERTSTQMKIWFWARGDSAAPPGVVSGAQNIDTTNWPLPGALFPSTECDFASHFGAHNIIINLTFCGDWAGATYNSDGCPGDCPSYVRSNPAAFAEAYWDIAGVRVYQ